MTFFKAKLDRPQTFASHASCRFSIDKFFIRKFWKENGSNQYKKEKWFIVFLFVFRTQCMVVALYTRVLKWLLLPNTMHSYRKMFVQKSLKNTKCTRIVFVSYFQSLLIMFHDLAGVYCIFSLKKYSFTYPSPTLFKITPTTAHMEVC